MKHGDKLKKLSRNRSHRRALFINLSTALLKYENIVTTLQKAKALRPYVEKIITKSKNNTIHSKRLIAEDIKDRAIVTKLFNDIAQRYKNRNGGYTRIYKLGYRKSDGAETAMIELVEEALEKK
jgi:large subunit ribosomal protein L17